MTLFALKISLTYRQPAFEFHFYAQTIDALKSCLDEEQVNMRFYDLLCCFS